MSSILLPISPAGTTSVASGLWLASGINVISASQVSGAVQVSGGVTISGGVTVSGAIAVLSGVVNVASGNVYVTSGFFGLNASTQSGLNYVLEVGNKVLTPSASGTGLGSFGSGGITLASSGPMISVTLRSISGNSPMLIGGTTTTNAPSVATANVPAPGVGVELFANESLTLKVSNTNLINVMNQTAGTSGQRVTIIGIQQT